MQMLPGMTSFVVVVLAVAALGVALLVGLGVDLLVRNRARRLRLRMPVVRYYRHLAVGL